MILNYFLRSLNLRSECVPDDLNTRMEITHLFKYRTDKPVKENVLYIVPPENLDSAEKAAKKAQTSAFICCGVSKDQQAVSGSKLVFCDKPFEKVWETLEPKADKMQTFEITVMNLALYESSVAAVLNTASSYWNMSFYILDRGGQLLFSAAEKRLEGMEDIAHLFGKSLDDVFSSSIARSSEGSVVYLGQPFGKTSSLMSMIKGHENTWWMITVSQKKDELENLYAGRLVSSLIDLILDKFDYAPDSPSGRFADVFASIIGKRIVSADDIKKALLPAADPDKHYWFRFMIIAGSDSKRNTEELKRMIPYLAKNLPFTHFLIYESELVCVSLFDDQQLNRIEELFKPVISSKAPSRESFWLEEYLKKHQCRCAIDEACSRFNDFSTCWRITHDMLRICTHMSNMADYTCIRTDIFKPYCILDYAGKYFEKELDSSSFLLLCNPALITLYKYDFVNNTTLCDILLTYLVNNRSVERTAQKCFMHRNTIKSKLELIQQITPLNLDDPEVFVSLLVSFRMINYYAFYLGGAIDDAKKNY